MKKHCYSVKSASFHILKKAFLLKHMYRKHDTLVPKPNLSSVLKNHINRKYLGTLKSFVCNKCDFFAKTKGVLKFHKQKNPL